MRYAAAQVPCPSNAALCRADDHYGWEGNRRSDATTLCRARDHYGWEGNRRSDAATLCRARDHCGWEGNRRSDATTLCRARDHCGWEGNRRSDATALCRARDYCGWEGNRRSDAATLCRADDQRRVAGLGSAVDAVDRRLAVHRRTCHCRRRRSYSWIDGPFHAVRGTNREGLLTIVATILTRVVHTPHRTPEKAVRRHVTH